MINKFMEIYSKFFMVFFLSVAFPTVIEYLLFGTLNTTNYKFFITIISFLIFLMFFYTFLILKLEKEIKLNTQE